MKCWKCGAEVQEPARYCGSCGADLSGPQAPPGGSGGMDDGHRHDWDSGGSGGETLLRVFAAICAAVYGFRALLTLLTAVRFVVVHAPWFVVLRAVLFGGISAVLGVWMCLTLLMLAFRRTRRNSDGLLLCLCGGAACLVLLRLLALAVNVAAYPAAFSTQLQTLLRTLLGAGVTVGGVCLLLRFVLGELPFADRGPESMSDALREAFASFAQAAGGGSAREAQQYGQQYTQQDPYGQQGPYGGQYGQQDPYGGRTPPGASPLRLKTDRSLLLYLLLTVVTCGIYHLYMIYSLARDVNAACHGDGQTTPGLLQFFLLSLVTCGFYGFYWYYRIGDRLYQNGPRCGVNIQETGTTILLWMVVGLIFCGIGTLVGLHLLFRNTNAVCAAYNASHGF